MGSVACSGVWAGINVNLVRHGERERWLPDWDDRGSYRSRQEDLGERCDWVEECNIILREKERSSYNIGNRV